MNKIAVTIRQLRFFPLLFVLYEMASYLSNDAYLPAMPDIKQHLFTNEDSVRLSLTSWFMGGCLIQLLVGPISDYVGRRKVLLIGGIVFCISTMGCGLVTDINWLIGLRFIEGMTIATMAVTGYATIHELYDTKKAIQTIAFMNSISVLAPAFGPLFGAFILQWSDWRTIFTILAVWAMFPLLLLYWDMPETAPIKQAELKLSSSLSSYYKIITNGRFMTYMLASRMIFSAMIIWLSAGPFLLSDRFHMDDYHFGLAQVFVFGMYIVGTKLNTWLLSRYALHTLLWQGWGWALMGSLYLMISANLRPDWFYLTLPGLMMITFGAGISLPIYSRLAIEQSSEPMGTKVAMTTFSMTLFGALATVVVNVFFNNSLPSLAITLSGCILCGFLLFFINTTFIYKDLRSMQ